MWQASLLPSSYDLGAMGYVDLGGGPAAHHLAGHPMTAVADLVGDTVRPADVRYTFTARQDGDDYTVNGRSPGPLLRARVGELVEVRLVNDNVSDGVTLHWHGVDVPNAEDGVAGVTQDAVLPGQTHVYRWIARASGTYWYHSHQVSHEQVRGGLLGPILIEPDRATPDVSPAVSDQIALLHDYGQGNALNGVTGPTTIPAEPGQQVRVRIINTGNGAVTAWAPGTPFTVVAIDGTDLVGPTPLTDQRLNVPGGGRMDLLVTAPARVEFDGSSTLILGSDPLPGEGGLPPSDAFDPLTYGAPAPLPFDPDRADRTFDYRIGHRPGFLDGKPGMWWTINGHLFPDVPMFMVSEGDVVRFHITNKSGEVHPMHLHGHHAVVLSRNGVAATGSPWWVDSLDVASGDSYEVAFLADNPGIWMDHCHNLPHAAEGLVAHLMYDNVTSSFRIGGSVHNEPE